MRMVDLNLDVIKQAHAEDIKNYHLRSRPPPQHLHRHWLLAHVAKLEEAIIKNCDLNWEPWATLFKEHDDE